MRGVCYEDFLCFDFRDFKIRVDIIWDKKGNKKSKFGKMIKNFVMFNMR